MTPLAMSTLRRVRDNRDPWAGRGPETVTRAMIALIQDGLIAPHGKYRLTEAGMALLAQGEVANG